MTASVPPPRWRRRLLLGAAALVAFAGVALLLGGGRNRSSDMANAPQGGSGHAGQADASAPAGLPRATRAGVTQGAGVPVPAAGRDLTEVVRVDPGQPAPSMAAVIARLRAEGVRDGLAAFNPPGTRPPLVGIAVPADFPLPDGYVRHHQTTDDGQDIEAILMFSPDYTFVDADGSAIVVPPDRVVPARYAPPGLPLRTVRIPPPLPTPGGGA